MGLTPFFSAKIFRDLDIKYFLHLQLYCCTISKWQTPIFRSVSLVMIFLKKWVKISYILGHLAFFKNHNYANSQNKQTNIEPLSWMIWVFTSDDRLGSWPFLLQLEIENWPKNEPKFDCIEKWLNYAAKSTKFNS